MGRFLGVEAWPVWLSLSSLFLVSAASCLDLWIKKNLPRLDRLASVWIVGFVAIGLVNPLWTFFSATFTASLSAISPLFLGAFVGYLVGFIASLRGCGRRASWIGRTVGLFPVFAWFALKPWWALNIWVMAFVAVMVILVGEGRFRLPLLIVFTLWPSFIRPVIVGGLVWAPLGLLYDSRDSIGLNLALYVDFMTSMGLWVFLTVSFWVALFGFRFFFHQLRKLIRLDSRRNALPLCSASVLGFGLLNPSYLGLSLVLATGSICALLFDAVQTM
jgi:hypothetical protein